jgi:invasion protein IalB
MKHRTASGAVTARALSRVAMAALALTAGEGALAQQRSTNPPAPPSQGAPGPNAGQAEPGAPDDAAQNGQQQLPVIASPWTRYCVKNPAAQSAEGGTKEVCFTASDGHLKSGQKVVIALLIEREGSDTKLLRVTLPLGVALVPGARIVIDEHDAMTAPYVVCLPQNGCMADYKADGDLIEKLKKGQTLAIQAFEKGKPIAFTLPLAGFAKAYEGPASDPPT